MSTLIERQSGNRHSIAIETTDAAHYAACRRRLTAAQRRWLSEDGKTGLQELADEYGVSAERIRQIEAAAMKKLRKVIEDPVEA